MPPSASGTRADRVRVALLVSPWSFESFYRAHLGLDRRRFVDSYRNDFVWNYAEGLRPHGVDVVAYVPAYAEAGREDSGDGFSVRFLPLRRRWRLLEPVVRHAKTPVERYLLEAAQAHALLGELWPALAADGIDVLYVQEYWTGRFDVLSATSPVPVIAGEHGGSGGLHVHTFKRAALRRAAAITVQSSAERRRLRRYGRSAELITNGVDTRYFTPPEIPPREPRVLVVARLDDRQKRIGDLIDALGRLPAPWTLDIAGRGPDDAALRARAERSGAADRITFHGWVRSRAQLRSLYQRAGVFALPSVWEAVTLAVLEAMACGVPPVVTPLRPFRDVIRDGQNGLFVPLYAPDRLAAAIQAAHAERDRLGPAARRTVEERYDRDATMARLAGIVRDAAGRDAASVWGR